MSLLKGKTAVVTGSSRGIGRAIAEAYSREGANVVICSTKEETAISVANELSQNYGNVTLGVGLNVTNEEEVKGLITKSVEKFGTIDILVNNAGITKDNLILRLQESDWDDVLNTNLKSAFFTTKAVIRIMMKKKAGKLINVSSIVGEMGNPGQSNYAASKAGLIGFTKSVAREYASKGITANVIAPGYVETDMIETLPKDYLDKMMSNIPLGRLASVEDVAKVAVFLASPLADYLTGQVLRVDGGMTM